MAKTLGHRGVGGSWATTSVLSPTVTVLLGTERVTCRARSSCGPRQGRERCCQQRGCRGTGRPGTWHCCVCSIWGLVPCLGSWGTAACGLVRWQVAIEH